MYTLALETTDTVGSIALFRATECLAFRWLPEGRRSAQSLAPGIQELLRDCSVRPAEIGLVGVSVGPGSFTGIRIGVVTAKTFAYAVGAEILGVDTLEAVAACCPPAVPFVAAIADAQRGDVVGKLFQLQADGTWLAVAASGPRKPLDWLSTLPHTSDCIVAGPGVVRFRDLLAEAGYRLATDDTCRPNAKTVGQLAWTYYASGRRDDLWTMMPHYFRPSYAEEKASPAANASG